MNNKTYNIGLDAGSTTLKLVITDQDGYVIYTDYTRHHADIPETLINSLRKIQQQFGNIPMSLTITGSAGMGLSERFGIPFIQEVVAATVVIKKQFPDTKTLIDIGGEDSKMIFFNKKMHPDIRMNGNCAGGTGAFIDQMAAILNISVNELNDLALQSENIYPIASRCGVFSKTDIQNLISLNVKREDIAASVFHAVATQVISSLSRGYSISSKVFLCGGPFAFIPALRTIFKEKLGLKEDDLLFSEYAQVIPAWGASLSNGKKQHRKEISEYINLFHQQNGKAVLYSSGLTPLFRDNQEMEEWKKKKEKNPIHQISFDELEKDNCYIGIDSGSTTTKIVAIDEQERVFFTFYKKNEGKSLETVNEGLSLLEKQSSVHGKKLIVCGSCSTGYGEDLIKTAFNLNFGIVETIAHYMAAHKLNPDVSFILDIGGQDMKAIFVENGAINKLEINEACSSGCGSFIDSFAQSLNCPLDEFVQKACSSQYPCDLGTRCTVFMNSKVKQSLREGASLSDIASGLAYSVVKNCLYKVLKLKSPEELGNHIILQGGTMRNISVVRAFELLTNKEVIVSNFPELMGAYGAALYARKKAIHSDSRKLELLTQATDYTTEPFQCIGCENNCRILKNIFASGKVFYSGNKCEKIYTNKGEKKRHAFNMSLYKNELAYKKKLLLPMEQPYMTIGIPRALNMFENFPFWYTLLTLNKIQVQKSSRSTFSLYEKGLNTVMADNICLPAKILHGHILDLAAKGVDRILFPYVIYEQKEAHANNSYNCPIVSGYSDVIKSAIQPEEKFNIPVDSPVINFNDEILLKKACRQYIKGLLGKNFSGILFDGAFQKALAAREEFGVNLYDKAVHLMEQAKKENRLVILLAGRPYHNDPLIQHKISEIITSFGIDVITEDIVRDNDKMLSDSHVIPQWSYINRIMKAAQWVANSEEDVHFVQITSFGCGPDAFIIDETADILRSKGKNHTLLKVDDVNNAGSLRLRIRSLIESLKFKNENKYSSYAFETTPEFLKEDRKRTILVPFFSEFYSPFIPAAFKLMGYEMTNMLPSDSLSAELGLKYANNEICYPATLVIGDCIRTLQSGKYDPDTIAFAITQTGGQCRATNYIALIKKALLAAGFGQIPVVSVSIMNTINAQSGFNLDIRNAARAVTYTVLFADALSKMYYATAVREKEKGIAAGLKEKYIRKAVERLEQKDSQGICNLLKEAAYEFNNAAKETDVPRIGIVGEIYLKYNSFGHQYVVDWLVEQGIEPVIPPLSDFFTQYFPNTSFNEKNFLDPKSSWNGKMISMLGEAWMNKIISKIDKAASGFRFYEPTENIRREAQKAEKIINLAAQFGEGWLIPAELISFAERNIHAAISLQPFGCIANHIVSKGIEKKIKEFYPDMNILHLDFDGGVSEVNVRNRLHFIMKQVTSTIEN
jgi:predicted CoA-substrate-specific enzyme activase